VENASGFGFDQTRLLAHYGIPTDDAFVACSLIAFLILAAVILAWRKIEVRIWIKTAAAVLIYFAAATAAVSLRGSISLSLSPYLRGMLRALGPLAVAGALYSTVTRPYFAAMSLLFLAGTVGNCISLLLPPFAVIDFFGLYRTSIHGYVYANAADAYLLIAVLMILLVPVYLPVRSAIRSLRRRAKSV
jgi:lipoprotein signal peptidase